MKRKHQIYVAICFIFSLVFPQISFAMVLYDDFSAPYINKNKWTEGELVREIDTVSQKFVSKLANPSPIVISSYPYVSQNSLSFSNPNSVNSIQADVAVPEYSITNLGDTRARLEGRWYNDGTSGGGYAGDIWAEVDIRGTPQGLRGWWYVGKYMGSDSSTLKQLASGYFLTSINTGETYNLYISYDSVNNQFLFKIGAEEHAFGPASLPIRAGNAANPFKAFNTRTEIDNATSSAYVSAVLDNVYKNGVLYDDFSSSTLDGTKWTAYEIMREVSGGKFVSGLRSLEATSSSSSSLSFPNPESIRIMKAKVTPLVFDNPDGAFVVSRLEGIFYNDTGNQASGYIGEVFVQLYIGSSGSSPTASYSVLRDNDVAGDTYTTLASYTFPISVSLFNTYDLQIYWDGSRFLFRVNDMEADYTPSTSIFPANNPSRRIEARIRSFGNSENAFIKSNFDDVMTGGSPVMSDFDMDSRTDIGIYRPSTGSWFIIPSSTGVPYGVAWGSSTDIPIPGDYDGDGKADIAIFHPSTGSWFIIPSSTGVAYGVAWGSSSDIPVPGDYDGDGKADIAIFHPGTGSWFIIPSSTGIPYGVAWGSSSEIPVPGDYDGDGKTDIAIYHPDTGSWFVIPSSTGVAYGVAWGSSSDIPVPGDYDGDGKTDVAIFHPSTGSWFIIPSSTGVAYGVAWGSSTDIPVPGDYDGDGKTDIAIYHPDTGSWFVIPSSTEVAYGVAWGSSTDIPLCQ